MVRDIVDYIKKENQKEYITKHIILARNVTKEDLRNIVNPSKEKKMLFGTGGDVLERVLIYYSENFTQWLESAALPPRLEDEWMRIGREVINWTCAPSPIRV